MEDPSYPITSANSSLAQLAISQMPQAANNDINYLLGDKYLVVMEGDKKLLVMNDANKNAGATKLQRHQRIQSSNAPKKAQNHPQGRRRRQIYSSNSFANKPCR